VISRWGVECAEHGRTEERGGEDEVVGSGRSWCGRTRSAAHLLRRAFLAPSALNTETEEREIRWSSSYAAGHHYCVDGPRVVDKCMLHAGACVRVSACVLVSLNLRVKN
jgi:hypothetical protein